MFSWAGSLRPLPGAGGATAAPSFGGVAAAPQQRGGSLAMPNPMPNGSAAAPQRAGSISAPFSGRSSLGAGSAAPAAIQGATPRAMAGQLGTQRQASRPGASLSAPNGTPRNASYSPQGFTSATNSVQLPPTAMQGGTPRNIGPPQGAPTPTSALRNAQYGTPTASSRSAQPPPVQRMTSGQPQGVISLGTSANLPGNPAMMAKSPAASSLVTRTVSGPNTAGAGYDANRTVASPSTAGFAPPPPAVALTAAASRPDTTVAKPPRLPEASNGRDLCTCARPGPRLAAAGRVPLALSLAGKKCAQGYDVSGDGYVDSVDTNGDGIIDSLLSWAGLADDDRGGGGGFALDTQSLIYGNAGTDSQLSATDVQDEQRIGEETLKIWNIMDTAGHGVVSKLDFLTFMTMQVAVSDFVLPGVDCSGGHSNEATFDAIDKAFRDIAAGSKSLHKAEFIVYFQKAKARIEKRRLNDLFKFFSAIDTDSSGSISKFELFEAVLRDTSVALRLVPDVDGATIMSDDQSFDAVDAIFEAIAGGKRRIDYHDFKAYFRIHKSKVVDHVPHHDMNRSTKKVLIIGPGFGRELTPKQAAIVTQAGYQIQWILNVPNPEQPNFPMQQHLPVVKSAIDQFQPDLLVTASKGGHYVIALWQAGYWHGPTLMINVHPSITKLPQGAPIVIAHGSNDELYPRSRASLEALIKTAGHNQGLLYYAGSSGTNAQGQFSRMGDKHNMETLVLYDLLPRLMDAAMCHSSPEMHLLWSWRDRLTAKRLDAEEVLGYSPDALRRHWQSKGADEQKLFDVKQNSEEWNAVCCVFSALPREPANYPGVDPKVWPNTRIARLQRIENGALETHAAQPYYESVRASLEEQGITFEPGVHTRWGFHGTDAIDSIVLDPITGFQPLASGARLGSLWGSGTYFARDAKYVVDAGFSSPDPKDSSKRMLICLLNLGIPTLGDPGHKGVLPARQGCHHYNSTVDSLSSPEIYIMQHPAAAYPAYVITFF